MYNIKLLIADRSLEDCQILRDTVNAAEIGLQISVSCHGGAALLAHIEAFCPDIVLTEIELPELSGLDILQLARGKGYHCRFIVMSERRNFDYAYIALKYHAEDYLLKPVQADEVNTVLMRISNEIRCRGVSPLQLGEAQAAQRYVFITQVCADPTYCFHSPEEINQAYATHFQGGLFVAMFIKLDCPSNVMNVYENSPFLHDEIQASIHRHFGMYCYDILFDRRPDGILFLLNYDRKYQKSFAAALEPFFTETRNLIHTFPSLKVTLCVGREYTDLSHPYEVKNDALDARWLRMSLGTERIVYRQNVPPEDNVPYLRQLNRQILHSCEILDVETFRKSMDAYFNLPYSVLVTRESRKFLRRIINQLFEMDKALLSTGGDTNHFKKELDFLLNMSVNFEQYRNTFCTHIIRLMTQITENYSSQYSRAISEAVTYIIHHYSEPVSLNTVAANVELSPNYFSELFKKETGQNFSDFLISYRIEKAKKLLSGSDKNISEIAQEVGYSDVRYFGKLFKRKVEITPSEYKKLHRA